MCYNILFLDFKAAYQAHEYLFVTLPFLAIMSIEEIVRRKKHRKVSIWNQVILYLYITGLLIFTIFRNIN